MAVSILEVFKNTLGDNTPTKLSSYLGESTEHTRSAIGTILPAIAGGFLQKGHTAEGASSILDYLDREKMDDSLLDNLGGSFEGGFETTQMIDKGTSILDFLLSKTNNLDSIVDVVTSRSGLGRGSANTLIKLITPVVMAIIARQIKSQKLDAPGLSKLLVEQKDALESAAPTGLFDTLGFTAFIKETKPVIVEKKVEEDEEEEEEEAAEGTGGPSAIAKIIPWIILVSIAVGLFYFMRSCGGRPNAQNIVVTTEETAEESLEKAKEKITSANNSLVKSGKSELAATRRAESGLAWITLPGGKEMQVNEGSFVDQFYTYLSGSENKDSMRFTFDQVTFQPGSAMISLTSAMQLQNVADLLNHYPQVRVRVEGHTDGLGDPAANHALSEQRAFAVKSALQEMGVPVERIEAIGFGGLEPITTNETEEGRLQNRRVDLCILSK